MRLIMSRWILGRPATRPLRRILRRWAEGGSGLLSIIAATADADECSGPTVRFMGEDCPFSRRDPSAAEAPSSAEAMEGWMDGWVEGWVEGEWLLLADCGSVCESRFVDLVIGDLSCS